VSVWNIPDPKGDQCQEIIKVTFSVFHFVGKIILSHGGKKGGEAMTRILRTMYELD
jgi:hypothetical protein